jgi:hypothetical protein
MEMKRIVLGVVAGLSLLTVAACGSGGGGQSTECKDYIACYEKTGGTKGSLDSTYGAMGTCWSTGVAATAESCTSTCKSSLATTKTSYPDAGC